MVLYTKCVLDIAAKVSGLSASRRSLTTQKKLSKLRIKVRSNQFTIDDKHSVCLFAPRYIE